MKRGGWLKRSDKFTRRRAKRLPPPRPDERAMDRVDRENCLLRAGYKCERCNLPFIPRRLECHHIITRRLRSLRHVAENHLCLCTDCHLKWWHRDSTRAAREAFMEARWPGRLERLRAIRKGYRRLRAVGEE